jgi:hypothetical protein
VAGDVNIQAGNIGESQAIGNGFEPSKTAENVAHQEQTDDTKKHQHAAGGGQREVACVDGGLGLCSNGILDARVEMLHELVEKVGGGAILPANDGVGGFEVGVSRDVSVISLLVFLAERHMSGKKLLEQLLASASWVCCNKASAPARTCSSFS